MKEGNKMEFSNLPNRKTVLAQLFELWKPQREIEIIPPWDALNRVTSDDVFSVVNLPVYRSSVGDGIAVASERFKAGVPDTSHWVKGVDYAQADTGDDFPDEFDAVIMVEDVTFLETGGIKLVEGVAVHPGVCVRESGSVVKKGEFLMGKNLPIRPLDMSCLIMGGLSEIKVYKKPVVAFLPTGNELISAGSPLTRGKNIDTNSYLVKNILLEYGAEPLLYPILKDDPMLIREMLEKALKEADIVIINGGSSKGSEDYNAILLKEKGQLICHGVAAAPGRPMAMAIVDNKPVINLPGPSIAAFYGLDWCIKAIICKYLNLPLLQRPTIKAYLEHDVVFNPPMEVLRMVELRNDGDTYFATILDSKTTSNSRHLKANGLLITPPSGGVFKKGEKVEVELLRGAEFI